MSKILRIFACLFALFFVVDASGAGYTCSASSKKYTSCKSGYYMTASSSSSACNTTAKAGNACRACSVMGSLYTCSGGTTCPKLKSVTCSAGTYLPAGKTSCSTCTAGYKCPGGTFTASATVTQGRTQCTAGTYAAAGKSSCSTCAAGTYSGAGASSCTVCGTNKWSNAGASSCSSCDTTDGYGNSGTTAASHAGSASCKVTCAAGTYVKTANAACTSVGTGYYRAAHTVSYGSTSTRSQCPANYRDGAAAGSQAGCKTSCAAGTYVATANAACTSVGTGYYRAAHTVSYGSTSTRSQCPANYRDGTAAGSQAGCRTSCAAGTYVKTANAACTSVGTGYYRAAHTVNYGGTSTRSQCPANYRDGAAASSQAGCKTSCAAGTYVKTANAACTSVGTGYYRAAHTVSYGSTSTRSQCPANYRDGAATGTQAGCKTSCAAGTYVKTANAACTSVGTGYYRAAHTVSYGSTSTRSQCPANYRDGAATGTQAGCKTSCDAGTYVATANAACTSVGTGYYRAAHTVSYGSTSTRNQCPANYRDGAATGSQNNCIGIFEKTGGQNNPTKPTGCATMEYASSCTPPTCEYQKNYAGTVVKDCTPGNCTKAITKLTANADRYVNGTTSCPACSSYSSTYTKSDGGSITYNSCYITRSKTGSQVNGSTPSGCASVTAWNACTPGTCTYKDYLGQTGETCTPSNCTKTPKTVTASTDHYVSGTSCPTCPTGYPNSDGGTGGVTVCYSNTKSRAWTGSQVNGSTPSGCASVTAWNACSNSACSYVAYSNSAGTGDGTIKSGCSSNNASCTKTPKTVTAKENYYVSGTSCLACSSYSSTYTKSDGGSISSAYCYRTATKTGSQVNGSTPSGCASVTAWNACTPGTCTYKDYASATDTTCTPTNCTKTVAAVAAKSGYYDGGTTCPACPTAYPNSAANNEGGIAKCYMSVSGGKYVAKANATSVSTCAAGTYKAAHSVYYGSTSSCSVCGNNSYSNAGAASCTACATDYSNSGTAAASHAGASSCKISCDAGTRVASANAGCTTPSGNWYVGAHTVSQGSISSVNSCLTNYVITGTSPSNHDASSDCKITCAGGSYIAAANNTSCTKVGAGYWAAASVVPQGSTGVRNACESGMTTIGFGAGADESGDCGRVLNIGDEKIYLRSTKKTSPSLNISINGDVFYGSMSTAHAGSSLKINSGGTRYSVYDDSNPPPQHSGGNN